MKARERRSVQSPRTRFARALVPRVESVAAVLRFRSGDQRLISRDAAERNASRPTGR
jgi:hypothetical protein